MARTPQVALIACSAGLLSAWASGAALPALLAAITVTSLVGPRRAGYIASAFATASYIVFCLGAFRLSVPPSHSAPRLLAFLMVSWAIPELAHTYKQSERKRLQCSVEEELRATADNLKLLVEAIPALVFVLDPKARLSQVNQRVIHYSGLTREAAMAGGGFSAVHPDDRPRLAEVVRDPWERGLPFSGELRYRRHDGVYRWFQANAHSLRNGQGRIIRWYVILTDIEERKAMEASLSSMHTRLAEAQRSFTVAEMAASVVHEISQPLSAMAFNSQTCLRELESNPGDLSQVRAAIERIVKNSRQASQIVRNIRDLFRQRDPDARPVDVGSVLREVLLLHEARIQELGIAVNLSIGEALPAVSADRLQIQQVLLNLIRNAIESMESSSSSPRELDLGACRADGEVSITIADRGHGLIAPDRLFDAFFTTKKTGMGMGLRICKTIVEAHCGRLWAAPRPNGGTAFTFTLPIESAAPVSERA